MDDLVVVLKDVARVDDVVLGGVEERGLPSGIEVHDGLEYLRAEVGPGGVRVFGDGDEVRAEVDIRYWLEGEQSCCEGTVRACLCLWIKG